MRCEHVNARMHDQVVTITLDRPPLNILNIEMMNEICRLLDAIPKKEVKLLVLRAVGKTFSAGVEVEEHMGDTLKPMIESFHGIYRRLARLSIPSVAVVQGGALGGACELVVCCDMVLAADTATFGVPEVKLGVFPPLACLLFPLIMGRKKASALILSGDILSAREALELGLISGVVPLERLKDEANRLIRRFCKNSSLAMKYARESMDLVCPPPSDDVLRKIEAIYLDKLMATEDAQEGLKAFLEKRQPRWKDL